MQTMRRHPRWPLGAWGRLSFPKFPLVPCAHNLNTRPPHVRADDALTRLHSTKAPTRRRRFRRTPEGEAVPIGVDSLGQPGKIVVVPEQSQKVSRDRGRGKEISPEDGDRLALSSMLDALGEEASSLTSDTISRRLEECRESYATTDRLAPGDWEALRLNIASSFTYNQLSSYIAEHQRPPLGSEANMGRWRPGVSVFLPTGQGVQDRVTDRIASSLDLKGKPLLAERILRDCWQLSIIDEMGQLDLRLPSAFITLLLNASHFSFDEVASLHKSSIDITHSLGLVRITGKQNASESIREIIMDAVSRLREEDAGLGSRETGDPVQAFSADFLDWLGKTYGVAFEQNASRIPEKILYLAENKQGADDARRTLYLALRETRPKPVPFSTYLPAGELASVYGYNPENGVTWFDRQKSWFRWALPSVQAADSATHPPPFFDSHQTRLSDALLRLLRNPPPQSNSSTNVDAHESVTAAVGRCLFQQKPSFEEATLSAPQLGRRSFPRTFTAQVPRIVPFLESLSPLASTEGAQTYNLRFIPSPQFTHIAPELDVEVVSTSRPSTGNADSSFDVRKVSVIVSTNDVDYLLPENGLDLRFTRKIYRQLWHEGMTEPSLYPLPVEDIRQALQHAFVSSKLPRSPVPLPAFCHLTLPGKYLLSATHTGTPIEYFLPPVNDLRGAATQRYDLGGRHLNYRFYETGPFLAAHTTEVTLGLELPQITSQPVPDDSRETIEQDFHAFYIAACDMAFRIHKARHVGPDDL